MIAAHHGAPALDSPISLRKVKPMSPISQAHTRERVLICILSHDKAHGGVFHRQCPSGGRQLGLSPMAFLLSRAWLGHQLGVCLQTEPPCTGEAMHRGL